MSNVKEIEVEKTIASIKYSVETFDVFIIMFYKSEHFICLAYVNQQINSFFFNYFDRVSQNGELN